MPILDFEFIGIEPKSGVAKELANQLAEFFEAKPGGLWVKVKSVPCEQYAENNVVAQMPIFVNILMSKLPEKEKLCFLANSLADRISEITRYKKNNIHIVFLPSASGRVAFGGKLVE